MAWLSVLLALFGSTGGAEQTWPKLPVSGYIAGRLATEADLKRRNAIFLSLVDGKPSGVPSTIVVPQYAFLVQEVGKRLPVVVVQAEETEDGTLFGMRDAEGGEHVATEAEVFLLGSTHP